MVPEEILDEIYTTLLRGCVQVGYNGEEKKEVCGMLRQVLRSIVMLFSPLSIDSLSHLLLPSSSAIDETLADCQIILNIPGQMHLPICLHHLTFRVFLLNKDRCFDMNCCADQKAAHKDIVDNCVQLLAKML